MTAVPRHPAAPTAGLCARVTAHLREFWHAMRVAHHERVPH